MYFIFFFQAEDGIRDTSVPGVQTCALPIWRRRPSRPVGLAADLRDALPRKTLAADADAVLHRASVAEREIKLAQFGVDGDGSGGLAGRIVDNAPRHAAAVD